MSGQASKTNLGQVIRKSEHNVNAGSPSLETQRIIAGTITDIRMPGEFNRRQGSGILVRIEFDDVVYNTNAWLFLKEDYNFIRSTIGNRISFLKNPVRVIYYFHPTSFEDGYAEIICDNKQELLYNSYERNPTSMFINIIGGLGSNSKAPG